MHSSLLRKGTYRLFLHVLVSYASAQFEWKFGNSILVILTVWVFLLFDLIDAKERGMKRIHLFFYGVVERTGQLQQTGKQRILLLRHERMSFWLEMFVSLKSSTLWLAITRDSRNKSPPLYPFLCISLPLSLVGRDNP
jgi:hypothetical protein